MRITLHEYRNNPQLRLTLELAARRERAKALGRLFANILSRSKDGHASSSHLASQG
jgi:hypothetical protein